MRKACWSLIVISIAYMVIATTISVVTIWDMERANAEELVPAIACSSSLNNCSSATPSANDNQIIVIPQTLPTPGPDYVTAPAVPYVLTEDQKKAFLTSEKKVITHKSTKANKSRGLIPPLTKEPVAKMVKKPVISGNTRGGLTTGYFVNIAPYKTVYIMIYNGIDKVKKGKVALSKMPHIKAL